MNIVFIAKECLTSKGGVGNHVRKLSKCLLADGHSINLFCMNNRAKKLRKIVSGKLSCYIFPYKKSSLIRIISINIFFLFHLRLLLRSDVIHFHDYPQMLHWCFTLLPILKLTKKKLYITFHGWEGKFPPTKTAKAQRKICELVADGNICIGDYIEKWYSARPSIISYGAVSPQRFRQLTESWSDFEHIIFLGRLEEDSGLLQFLEAWPEISSRHPRKSLVLYGKGSLYYGIKNKIKAGKLEKVLLRSPVKDVIGVMSKSCIVIPTGYLTMLEAFSCQRPVLAICHNVLKNDYYSLIPGSSSMFWMANDFNAIVQSVDDIFLNSACKIKLAYDYSLKNTWTDLKETYYQVWKK